MSAILSADDLNDFISPGVACIKPVPETKPRDNGANVGDEFEIEVDLEGNTLEVGKDGTKTTLSAAQISLADCLACSGCVTSAEEVLVAQHSHEELLKAITKQDGKLFVASVSHQTRASLAVAYQKSIEEVDRVLVDLFVEQMGFVHVVGTSLGRKISLMEEAMSVIQKRAAEVKGRNGPTLSSICPGWVLYAEKTHPYVLPYVSNVKSAQQITGCLLKTLTSQQHDISRADIYHLSVMPCFDKKLESARKEENGDDETVDVDCVLTAKELVTLVEQSDKYSFRWSGNDLAGSDITSFYESAAPKNWPFIEYSWSNDEGSASGGYAYNYLDTVRRLKLAENPQLSPEQFSIENVNGRNSDIVEIRLIQEGTPIAKAAIVNGFRNIQNLVRKLKPVGGKSGTIEKKVNPLVARRRARKEGAASSTTTTVSSRGGSNGGDTADASACDYVEIMACPGGCINGGGQISAPAETVSKEWLQKSLEAYHDIPTVQSDKMSGLKSWSAQFCSDFGISEDRLVRTWFKEVEKPTDPNAILLGAKW
ncbi:cytosolic Fe-S cluster assembly factor Nar1p [[Candida] anglica]|uniref:Cytosolic Fe-S cluster assembly factor NAR1 n=1 Tax=[Candida] anglica TaxID=148631 RepID=A0ABP0EFE0_9ASCO